MSPSATVQSADVFLGVETTMKSFLRDLLAVRKMYCSVTYTVDI